MHFRMLSRIPGLYPLDTSSTFPQAVTTKSVSRYCPPIHTPLRVTVMAAMCRMRFTGEYEIVWWVGEWGLRRSALWNTN